ncbi:MAG TPA: TfoX/Sxy family protein [Verrucomicrobiae bacterium]|nr:TfoX/Sxy family protein [Verrucomicrobiae bacterium]
MTDNSFKDFVLDQLGALPELRVKAMFGAYGLYQGERFFGIIDEGRLFFKTDAKTKREYEGRGMKAFTYQARGKTVTMGFHEVPPEILEQGGELAAWARQSIQVAAAKE